MQNCFPEWSEEKLEHQLQKFYKYFCNLLIESLKGGTFSMDQLKEQVTIGQQSFVDKLSENKESAICILGHYGNWEWSAIRYGEQMNIHGTAVYKAIKNKLINADYIKTRQRSGIELMSIEEFKEKRGQVFNKPTLLFLIADQNPMHVDQSYWINFFGNTLPWYSGPEILARKYKIPVCFAKINCGERGKYNIDIEELKYDPNSPGDLTKKFVMKLEKQLRDDPTYWLWTHKRWKRAHLFDPKKHKLIK